MIEERPEHQASHTHPHPHTHPHEAAHAHEAAHTEHHAHKEGTTAEHHTVHHAAHSAGNGFNLNLGKEMELPKFDPKDLDYKAGLNVTFDILQLKQPAIEVAAKSEKFNMLALLYLVFGVVASPLAYQIFGMQFLNMRIWPSIGGTITSMIVGVVVAAVALYITTLVATKVFNGKGTFSEFFRVMGLAYLVYVLSVVGVLLPPFAPLIGLIVGVWVLVVEYLTLKTVFGLDSTNAVLTIIVTIVAIVVLGFALAGFGLGTAISANQMGLGAGGVSLTK